MPFDPQYADAIRRNIATFASLLADLGAPSLTLTYAGAGDEGNVEQCGIDWPHGVARDCPKTVSVVCIRSRYVNTLLTPETFVQEMDFDSACDALLSMVLEQHGHDGYHDGSGGGGTLTITAEGALTLDHYDIVEHHEEDTIVYAAPPKPEPLERPSPVIEQASTRFAVAF